MKITFLGATHEVTGSCTLVEVNSFKLLIDCGMEQGADMFVNQELPCNPVEIDAVILTHAHIDHSGKLPILYKGGFRGKIYATAATCSLCDVMLRDSSHIQMADAEWMNRKAKRAGKGEYIPLYNLDDTVNTLKRFVPCAYNEIMDIAQGISLRFTDMGHLLGSSAAELWLKEGTIEQKVVFTGDVGNTNQPILRDPMKIDEADYLIIESTYGDKVRTGERPDHIKHLTDFIQDTLDRGGNVIIPSLAIGRTQEILYFIRHIKQNGLISGHDGFPVYVDSPLASEATQIFLQCDEDFFDDEARAVMQEGANPLYFEGLQLAITTEDSKSINTDKRPKVIISAGGMCEGGRVLHHLKHNLWREESLILFVSYQSGGTLGRIIYEGAQTVRIFGEEISVRAQTALLPSVSGHADMNGLISLVEGIGKKPKMIFVNHGDAKACESFAATLEGRGYKAYAPYSGTVFDLVSEKLDEREGVRIDKKAAKRERAKTLYKELVDCAERLLAVAKSFEGGSAKDIAKLTAQINNLSDKWQR